MNFPLAFLFVVALRLLSLAALSVRWLNPNKGENMKNKLEQLKAALSELARQVNLWHLRRVVAWEDRYITQYQMQLEEAKAGMEEAARRREKAARKAQQTARRAV